MRALHLGLASLVLSIGCGGTEPAPVTPPPPAPVKPAPVASATPPQEKGPDLSQIPPPGTPKELAAAQITRFETKGGLQAIAIASHALPIVHCRVVVRAGNAASILAATAGKSRAGIANVVAELMSDGGAGRFGPRDVADHVDALGSNLDVDVSADRVVFSMAVTKDKLEAALDVLGEVVGKPRFDPGEFGKLKARELDRVKQAEKGSGGWMARSALYRDLFGEGHAYAEVDATDQSIANIELADVRAFYKKLYVTGNMFIVVAGDVEVDDAKARIEKHFGAIAKGTSPALPEATPKPRTETTVVLAQKPGSKQADIFVGELAIPRKDARWPELALAVHALGGGMTSRLFTDVREKRSLAYSTSASTRELASGPSVLALYAGTQTAMAGKSVEALMEHLGWFSASKPIDQTELDIAKTSLETGFLFRLETIGAVAGLAIDREILGYPGKDVYDYVTGYRTALRSAPLDKVRAIATEKMAPKGVVIAVAGDPSLAKVLRHFGPVRVVDPEKGFAQTEQLPADANAPLDAGK